MEITASLYYQVTPSLTWYRVFGALAGCLAAVRPQCIMRYTSGRSSPSPRHCIQMQQFPRGYYCAASKCVSPAACHLKCVAFRLFMLRSSPSPRHCIQMQQFPCSAVISRLGAFSLGDLLLGDGIISLVKENKNQNATK